LAAFAAIAVRAAPADLTPSRLRERGRALEWAVITAAILLVFVTAVNKALIVWPQGLMTPTGQKTFGYVAGAIANYWGAYSTGPLVVGDIGWQRRPMEAVDSEESYRSALALGEGLGMRPLVAHCHLGLGKLYRRTGKREQAQEHLTTATTMYREMGMTYW